MHENMSRNELEGRSALVTGASSGIGQAIAEELAAQGAEVVLVARRANELISVVDEIVSNGGKAQFITADLSDSTQVETVIDRSVGLLGHLDILVNSAGKADWAPALDTDRKSFDSHLALNAWAPLRLAQLAHPHLSLSKDAVVVMVGSIDALRPSAGAAAYGSSKAAMSALTIVLAKEWADNGIRIVQVNPGLIRTPMAAKVIEEIENGKRSINLVGRVGEPSEVAALVRYLVSPSGRFTTGVSFQLDGGAIVSGPFDI